MGTYTNSDGTEQSRFQIHLSSKVTGVEFGINNSEQTIITGLQINDSLIFHPNTQDNVTYVFCPGEAVGSLKKLGFAQPAYAGFAGAVLILNVDIPQEQLKQIIHHNQYMEVYQKDVVVSWQSRYKNNKLFIGVGGTKAFYADQTPHKDQEFALNRNLLQLNIVNNVVPEYVSWALGRDTKGATLTEQDLQQLESAGIANRWVGIRAVAYDDFPTLGYLYKDNLIVANARCTTDLGSGGVSFAPAAVYISRSAMNQAQRLDEFTQRTLNYGNSARTASSC